MKSKKEIKELKRLEREADKLWSEYIKKRDKRCIICGRADIQAHHIFGRWKKSTRWDIYNGVSLCVHHHRFCVHGLSWSRVQKESFMNICKIILGDEFYNTIKNNNVIFRPTKEDLMVIVNGLKEKINSIN